MGIWWLCWTVVLHTSVGLISLTHASMDSDNHTTTLCLLCSQEPPKSYHVLRTLQCPSESIRPMDIRFCCVVPCITLQSATRLEQNTATTTESIAEKIVESIIENLSAMRGRIVKIIWKNPKVTAQSISKEVEIAPRNVQEHLKYLQKAGVLRRVGPDKGGYWEIIKEWRNECLRNERMKEWMNRA